MYKPDPVTFRRIVDGDDDEFIIKFDEYQTAQEAFSRQLGDMVDSIAQEHTAVLEQMDAKLVAANNAYDATVLERQAAEAARQGAEEAEARATQIAAGEVAISALQPAVWQSIDADTVLAANGWYEVDFTNGPLTLTLPATPSANDMIRFYKSAGEAKGSIIARNGQTIGGRAEDMTIDREITSLEMVFTGTDWRVVR